MSTSVVRDYSEKRDFIRMRVNTEIILTFDSPNQKVKGICHDLSGIGMLIEVEDAIAEGSQFNTSLPSANKSFPAFETRVKIIRCSALDNGKYMLGAEILQPDK